MSDEQPTPIRSTKPTTFGSVASFLGGCLLPIVVWIGEVFLLMNGKKLPMPLGISIGAFPGVVAVILGFVLQKNLRELATGMIVGGCMVALIGGTCFALMNG